MQEEVSKLIEEGKEFVKLKSRYEGARLPDAGTPTYLIATDWYEKYQKYVFYQDLKYNTMPRPDEDHLQSHPG